MSQTPNVDPSQIKSILATDCGSTTTKAILIELREGEYRLIVRGEAPTTVEAPFEDVTKGVLNAIEEVEELAGRKFLEGDRIVTPRRSDGVGADLYVSTSSAGGGLQMVVAGVVKTMTAESAERAALGAGAIVMDALASNDGRRPYEQIRRIRHLRPDMILLSGGIDGGSVDHVVKLAEIIGAADPRPRLGSTYKLPVIYAGNNKAADQVTKTLGGKTDLSVTDNLRPVMERENLGPARDKIHDLFMEHVMAQAPGYRKLMDWVGVPIMPTPGAVGNIIQTIAKQEKLDVIGVDIGGATTDVFSVFGEVFNRTVSANLGMSYSISNVLTESGVPNVMRWVPFSMDEKGLRNSIRNKMIRPTTIPHTLEALMVEQALAREALRLAFEQHKQMAVGLRGIQKERTVSDTFEQSGSDATIVDMMALDLLIGSGGVLSHAPRRNQAAMMLIDAFLPEGVTRLAVDSIFMMPQLGVLAEVHPEAATEVFQKDCLIWLGTCVAPRGQVKPGKTILTAELTRGGGKTESHEIKFGDLVLLPLELGESVRAKLVPAKGCDVGWGPGKTVEKELHGGVVGLVLDGRGRPIALDPADPARVEKIRRWTGALNAYPDAQSEPVAVG
ncbi:MAG TPA: glutamate mutase L [bacterium]|nr:glutamate mutase L [bacterium]